MSYTTTEFIRKQDRPKPDYEGIFFDGNNVVKIIEFLLAKGKRPYTIELTWDGAYVKGIHWGHFTLARNSWLLWSSQTNGLQHASAQYIKDNFTELS